MVGAQEAVVFAEYLRPFEAWSILPTIDERITLKWIMPGDGYVLSFRGIFGR